VPAIVAVSGTTYRQSPIELGPPTERWCLVGNDIAAGDALQLLHQRKIPMTIGSFDCAGAARGFQCPCRGCRKSLAPPIARARRDGHNIGFRLGSIVHPVDFITRESRSTAPRRIIRRRTAQAFLAGWKISTTVTVQSPRVSQISAGTQQHRRVTVVTTACIRPDWVRGLGHARRSSIASASCRHADPHGGATPCPLKSAHVLPVARDALVYLVHPMRRAAAPPRCPRSAPLRIRSGWGREKSCRIAVQIAAKVSIFEWWS